MCLDACLWLGKVCRARASTVHAREALLTHKPACTYPGWTVGLCPGCHMVWLGMRHGAWKAGCSHEHAHSPLEQQYVQVHVYVHIQYICMTGQRRTWWLYRGAPSTAAVQHSS